MLRFLTDEDFDNDILRGVRHHRPDLDVMRVQDVGLMGQLDDRVLEWAALERRIVLTHDAHTMTREAYARNHGGVADGRCPRRQPRRSHRSGR